MDWSFFGMKACLTVESSEWEIGIKEIERVGISDCVKRQAMSDIGPHQSFNRTTRMMLFDFNESPHQTLLVLEDDVIFKDLSLLATALSELPDDWDIVYLGANLLNGTPERYSEHLFRVTSAWTTHAMGYNKRCIPFLLENQPGFSEEMFDCWLGEQLVNMKAYVVVPMVAWQRPHYSGIWGRSVDYTEIFAASEEKLR